MLGTQQQAIARLEDPSYMNQSLTMVRKYAEALGALVDVVVVPNEKAGNTRLSMVLNRCWLPSVGSGHADHCHQVANPAASQG